MPSASGELLAHPEVPPPVSPLRLVTLTDVDPWLAAGLALAAGAYVYGVLRLRARGDRWSPWRTGSFLGLGLGVIALATMSGLAAYDETLFSVHMVQHMVLSMVAPVFLALGAPVTLALRTLPAGSRARLLELLHSRLVRVLVHPLLGWLLFVGSPFALYYTGWYAATLDNRLLHELLHVHFVVVGCLFFWPMLGLDPLPGRFPYPLRMLLVAATLPFHAFLGLSIMSSSTVIAADHYDSIGRAWGASPLSDQHTGGALLWASGDLVGLLLLFALLIQWMRAEEREAVREDRRLDRLERLEQVPAGSQPVHTPSSSSSG